MRKIHSCNSVKRTQRQKKKHYFLRNFPLRFVDSISYFSDLKQVKNFPCRTQTVQWEKGFVAWKGKIWRKIRAIRETGNKLRKHGCARHSEVLHSTPLSQLIFSDSFYSLLYFLQLLIECDDMKWKSSEPLHGIVRQSFVIVCRHYSVDWMDTAHSKKHTVNGEQRGMEVRWERREGNESSISLYSVEAGRHCDMGGMRDWQMRVWRGSRISLIYHQQRWLK